MSALPKMKPVTTLVSNAETDLDRRAAEQRHQAQLEALNKVLTRDERLLRALASK
jgi:hypothetical protein